jgi:hypothetical protein
MKVFSANQAVVVVEFDEVEMVHDQGGFGPVGESGVDIGWWQKDCPENLSRI